MWTFDTEDDSQGHVYWVDFFNGVEHVSFDDPHRAIEWILEQRGEFWAVNLEYDLINLFGPLLDHLCVLTYGGFGLLKATLYRKPVKFYNTLRHWPLSVEEMGLRLGYPKLPFDPTNLRYCRRDTEVTYFFIQEMTKRYQELGIEEMKATLPGTALKFFLSKFCHAHWQRHESLDVWKFLAESRFGGRCEVFWTEPVRQTLYEYDINSSYPYAMKTERYPDLETITMDPKTPNFQREGVARIRVKAPCIEFPLLPYKKPGEQKLLFPIGTFTGTWTYPEIRLALKLGYQIEHVEGAIEYDAMPSPFAEYINFCYARRQAVKDTDPLMSYTLKIVMNSNFGKWGEEGDMQVISQGKRYTLSSIPKHSNMIWAAYILAYGRINLYQYIQAASRKGLVLYVDTDSVFIRCEAQPFPDSKELGALSFKGKHTFAHFKLPKLYAVGSTIKAKGIPKDRLADDPEHLRKSFFYDGVAEFMKPYRWIEAKKLKEQANVWRAVTKELQSTYDKRLMGAGGRTWPLTIS